MAPRVTCIVGGQYGSEGKGKVCGYLANEYDVAVRVGAPNAGHTLVMGKNKWKMQQIPVAGLVNPDIVLCIGAAGLINIPILEREMSYIKDIEDRLFIDRNAGILTEDHRHQEEEEKMFKGIGSTCEGVGAALRHKIKRDKTFGVANNSLRLKHHVINVSKYLNRGQKRVMIEGTQGTFLSLNHGPYPYCTSRDIIASSLLSDVGLAPHTCKEVIMVIRTYPIRVAGNSGPMCGKELTWPIIKRRSKCPKKIEEKTTVTKRVRRVCEFSMEQIMEACELNGPTQIALMFADYTTHKDYGKNKWRNLSNLTKAFVEEIEANTGVPVTLIGTSPDFEGMVDRRKELGIGTQKMY